MAAVWVKGSIIISPLKWVIMSGETKGNQGSVIVPQYGSTIITVFVLGKNSILKFKRSMKLTLQVIVVVFIAPTKIPDNVQQFVQIHSIYNNNIQGRRNKTLFSRTCSHSTQLFSGYSNSNGKKHARIVEIG